MASRKVVYYLPDSANPPTTSVLPTLITRRNV